MNKYENFNEFVPVWTPDDIPEDKELAVDDIVQSAFAKLADDITGVFANVSKNDTRNHIPLVVIREVTIALEEFVTTIRAGAPLGNLSLPMRYLLNELFPPSSLDMNSRLLSTRATLSSLLGVDDGVFQFKLPIAFSTMVGAEGDDGRGNINLFGVVAEAIVAVFLDRLEMGGKADIYSSKDNGNELWTKWFTWEDRMGVDFLIPSTDYVTFGLDLKMFSFNNEGSLLNQRSLLDYYAKQSRIGNIELNVYRIAFPVMMEFIGAVWMVDPKYRDRQFFGDVFQTLVADDGQSDLQDAIEIEIDARR